MGRNRGTQDAIVGRYEISTGIATVEPDEFQPGAYVLHVNGVPSSHIVPGQPRQLEFEYMRWIAAAVELADAGRRLTHLGGAGCSLARYFANVWPDSHNTVIELDAKLGELVRELFDIPKAPRVKIRAAEARTAVEGFPPGRTDVIIRDVFAGDTTPRPLTTVEFFTHCHRSLTPGGLYVANCGDRPPLTTARAEIAGLLEVFAHVAIIADPPMLKGRRYGNMILLASDTELPTTGDARYQQLSKSLLGGAVPAQYKDEEWARAFASGHAPLRDPEEPIRHLQMTDRR